MIIAMVNNLLTACGKSCPVKPNQLWPVKRLNYGGFAMNENAINIEGSPSGNFTVSAAAAQSAPLPGGIYDVYCDVDVFIMVDEIVNTVTTATGYKIFAGNVVPVKVADGRCIGAVAASAGTIRFQKVG